MQTEPKHIIFFDGVCNLCNNAVQFIIRRDSKNIFRFASLQSDFAREFLGENYPDNPEFDTIIYFKDGRLLERSTAVLHICKKLKFPWPLLAAFLIVPRFIRDFFYRIISRNRYKWFGKKDQCMIPSPELKNRFLD